MTKETRLKMNSNDMDRISRDKIRSDIHSNFFVEAGAGSGKTSVLVDRMVAMVEGGMDIKKICAITFTKAAAGEFYARFQKKLSESDSANAKNALKDIDLCFMGTLDAFCNMVLSEHPTEVGIPSDASIMSDSSMKDLYRREWSLMQNGSRGPALRAKCDRMRKIFYNPEDVFQSAINIIASNKNIDFDYVGPPAGEPDDIFGSSRTKLIYILTALSLHEECAYDSNAGSKKAWSDLSQNIGMLSGSWNDNLDNIIQALKRIKELRLTPDFDPELLGPGFEDFVTPHYTRSTLKWYEINIDEDALMMTAIDEFRFSVAMDLALPAMDVITEDLRKEGSLTFTDYLICLRDLLRDDAARDGSLISHIYERHSFFLIDEFQDTNPIQAEIFFYLTASDPDPAWAKCVPKPGSIFIVGDPKQSIYRFRSADVSSFLKVRSLFEDPNVGEVLRLTRNFRSSDPMCEWFNEVFTEMLPRDTAIQSRFSPIPIGEKQPYAAALRGAYSYEVAYSRSVKDSEDPSKVVEIISRIVNDPNITIQDRDTDGHACAPRKAEFRDFMLITPTKTHLTGYMKALSDAHIPFRIEGKVLFGECPALRSLSFIMSAVADPFDRKNSFAARFLSACEISREELSDLSSAATSMSPASIFSMLLEDKKIFAHAGTDNAEYVFFALELLRGAEISGDISSIKDGAELLKTLIDDESGEERCIQLLRDSNSVHVANLHKVKGLEAPIVILADPARKSMPPKCRIDYGTVPPTGYIFEIDTLRSSAFPDEEQMESDVLDSESNRLLYVAATRAANALIISDCVKHGTDRSDSNPWLPLLEHTQEDIFDSLNASTVAAPEITSVDTEELYRKAEEDSVFKDRASFKSSYRIDRPSDVSLKGKISSEDDFADLPSEEIRSDTRRKDAALIGTIVHRLMEVIVSSNNSLDVTEAVKDISDEYDARGSRYTDILTKVADTVRNGGFPQQTSVPQDILAELLSADEVHCELPFCYVEGSVIENGVIDVAYLKDGKWHIIDYKTDADANDLDEHHRSQLDAYIAAFKTMTGEDADAMAYHIDVL